MAHRIRAVFWQLQFENDPRRAHRASAIVQLATAARLRAIQEAAFRLHGSEFGFAWDGTDDAGWTDDQLAALRAEVETEEAAAAELPGPENEETAEGKLSLPFPRRKLTEIRRSRREVARSRCPRRRPRPRDPPRQQRSGPAGPFSRPSRARRRRRTAAQRGQQQ